MRASLMSASVVWSLTKPVTARARVCVWSRSHKLCHVFISLLLIHLWLRS